jgi:opacity protein-like surface antigen
MKNILIVLFILISCIAFGQDANKLSVNSKKGELSFGVRTTGSLFSESGNYFGIGAGWQVRYRMSKGLGTEWFSDWITTDIGGVGQRTDAHIGESMIIYFGKNPGKKNSFSPYIMGGFCGDYTKITSNLSFNEIDGIYTQDSKDRWSFATQLGLGSHYNITDKFDISLSTQYVLHFGADIESEIATNSRDEEYLNIIAGDGESLEGHWFLSLSANFVIVDLIKKK